MRNRAGWFPGAPGSAEGRQSALATHFVPAALHRTKSWNCLVKIVLKSIFTCIFHGSKVTLLRRKTSNWQNMSWSNQKNIWVSLPTPKQNHPPPDKWDVFKGFWSIIYKCLPKISLKFSNFVQIFCKCARYFLRSVKNGPLFSAHRAGWFPGAPGSAEGRQSPLASHFAPAALHRTRSWSCLVKIVPKSTFTCIFHGSKVTFFSKTNLS